MVNGGLGHGFLGWINHEERKDTKFIGGFIPSSCPSCALWFLIGLARSLIGVYSRFSKIWRFVVSFVDWDALVGCGERVTLPEKQEVLPAGLADAHHYADATAGE